MTFQTEFEFDLPKGYVDHSGNLHKNGVMRLATAADEILPVKDPRVQSNPAYLTIIILSRVIERIGGLEKNQINPKVIESLFVSDLSYLRQLYQKVNADETLTTSTVCPKCENRFEVDLYGTATSINSSASSQDRIATEVPAMVSTRDTQKVQQRGHQVEVQNWQYMVREQQQQEQQQQEQQQLALQQNTRFSREKRHDTSHSFPSSSSGTSPISSSYQEHQQKQPQLE